MKNRFIEFAVVLVLVALGSAYFLRTESMPSTPEPSLTEVVETTAPALPESPPEPEKNMVGLWSPRGVEVWQDFEQAKERYGYAEVKELVGFPKPNPVSVAHGQELFQANCSACHGMSLKGDGEAGAILDPLPTDLTRPEVYKYGHRELGIYRTAMYGIEDTGMAPWGDIIAPDDMWDIVHFVRSKQSEGS